MAIQESAAERVSEAPDAESDQESIERSLLAAIVESSDDAIISKTLDGEILTWNAGAARLFGYSGAEVIGKPVTLLIPPELHGEEGEILAKLRRGERVDHFETTRVSKDGQRIPISLSVSPVRNERGEIVAASKIARNISERVLADQLLREREERLSAETKALSQLNEWTARLWHCRCLADGLGAMVDIVIELLGATKGNVQLLDGDRGVLTIAAQRGFGQDFLDFFREVSAEDHSACGRALRYAERILIEDVECDPLFEPMRPIARAEGFGAVVSTPLISIEGARIGMLSAHFGGVHRPSEADLRRLDLFVRQASDFIQRCRMEEALRKSEEALREADRRKDEFLALLAHELRNPLAPIRYSLSTIKKPGRTAQQQKLAEAIIERQVEQMSRLLDDLLDVSRITRGVLQIKKAYTELMLVIGTAIDTARPILDAKRHKLTLDLPKDAVRLEADPVRLAQVFSNLLINAAKYTDPGGSIQLRAIHENGEVLVSVRDNGMGIAPEMVPRLFTLFARSDSALQRSEGGLGVGLALIRGLVQLHGGSIEARSDGVNRGSEFLVRMPVGTPDRQQTEQEDPADQREKNVSLRILVVDDNRDAAESCAALLGLAGHEVRIAFNATQALDLAVTYRPDVLLLDIGLPDMNGYQLAEKIRAMPWARTAVFVAVSGWGQGDDKRRAFEAGFDHHLTKPVAGDTLESLLCSIAH